MIIKLYYLANVTRMKMAIKFDNGLYPYKLTSCLENITAVLGSSSKS